MQVKGDLLWDRLDSCLPELRKIDGDYYYKKSLGTIRYGIQRHFAKLKGIDIVSDPEFAASTEVFRSVIQEGKGAVKHKEVITPEDMEKLYNYFDAHLNSRKVLPSKVFVDVMLYFCNRGRENPRLFSSQDFNFGKDSKGHEYVYTVKDRKTKNHQDDVCFAREFKVPSGFLLKACLKIESSVESV